MPADRPWLLVSKPLRAPFRDGSTVLVRNLVQALPLRLAVAYFGDPKCAVRPGYDRVLPAPPMSYAPGLGDKARVLRTLLAPAHIRWPLCFFFTPNRGTSTVLATLRRLQPWRRVVQSITSSADAERVAGLLRGLDAVVVASDHTRRRLEQAGVASERIHRIPPGVPLVSDVDPTRLPEHRRLLYAGDLDADVVDRIVDLVPILRRPESAGWRLTVACRPKDEHHAKLRADLVERLGHDLADDRVELLGEVEDMDRLLRSTSVQLYLADHVRNKVDLPLVLLEGLARGVPLVAWDFAPISEIFSEAAAQRRSPGLSIPLGDMKAFRVALGELMTDAATLVRHGEAARTVAEDAFSTSAMAQGYAALYEKLA